MAKKIKVFVYGTLKEGFGNHGALSGSKFLGRAVINGPYRLVDLGWYPALLRSTMEQAPVRAVGGEVYEVDQDTLDTLDMIEGHPSYYCRQKVLTSLGTKAWAYMLPPDYSSREAVDSVFWNQNEAEQEWLDEQVAAS